MLDDQELNRELTADDKQYLEEFTNVAILSFTNTKITSLNNLPDLEQLRRIELNGNGLAGSQLVHLLKYKNLHTIKFSDNNVTDFAELEEIKELNLCKLDLTGSPIAGKEDYREKVFAIFEDLEVLDGEDKDGNPVDSDEDDGEEGEGELDEETLKRLKEQGFAVGADDDDEDEEYDLEDDGEELEGSYGDEDDESEEQPIQKRKK